MRSLLKNLVTLWGRRPGHHAALMRRTASFERLHIGCGGYWIPGWLNVGLISNEVLLFGSLRRVNGADLLNYDVTLGLPVPNGGVSWIYSSHFIDCIPYAEARKFVREALRVLKPGGRIRLTFPALEFFVERYAAKDEAWFRRLVAETGTAYPDLKTMGDIFMGQVHGWGHRWCFDRPSMERLLREAGFANITYRSFRESDMPDIDRLEPDVVEKHMQTVYVEASKS